MEDTKRTVYALGFFDGVHLGHQALLAACWVLAESTGCKAGAVTFDAHPGKLVAGHAPLLISSAAQRRQLLEDQGMEVIVTMAFDEELRKMPWQDFFRLLLEKYGAAGLVCGDDFRFGYKGEGNAALLRDACAQAGIPCTVVPERLVSGIRVSSTHIRELLEAGDVEEANRFLGHPHILTGTVVRGQQLGRTLGIPTANLTVPEGVVTPRLGVYACRVRFDGREYPAVTNIGTRPTVSGSGVTVEPWILGFEGDLYGRELTVEFHKFLRPEKKFSSLDQLQQEIRENARQTLEFFGI